MSANIDSDDYYEIDNKDKESTAAHITQACTFYATRSIFSTGSVCRLVGNSY
jgi:hypothetical protein